MAINTDVIGKTYPSTTYAVGREKIREYAQAVGETQPLYLDLDAAREAGYDDLVAGAQGHRHAARTMFDQLPVQTVSPR